MCLCDGHLAATWLYYCHTAADSQKMRNLQFRGPSFLGPLGGPKFRTSGLNIKRKKNHFVVQSWDPIQRPSSDQKWTAVRPHGRTLERISGTLSGSREGRTPKRPPQRRRQRHAHIRARPSCVAPCGRNTCARGSAMRCSSATSSTMLVVGATPCCRFVRCAQWTRRCSSKICCARTAAAT